MQDAIGPAGLEVVPVVGGNEKVVRWCVEGGREVEGLEGAKKGPDGIRREGWRLEAGKGIHFTIRSFRLGVTWGDLGDPGEAPRLSKSPNAAHHRWDPSHHRQEVQNDTPCSHHLSTCVSGCM
jgi:hypothetical protein